MEKKKEEKKGNNPRGVKPFGLGIRQDNRYSRRYISKRRKTKLFKETQELSANRSTLDDDHRRFDKGKDR